MLVSDDDPALAVESDADDDAFDDFDFMRVLRCLWALLVTLRAGAF